MAKKNYWLKLDKGFLKRHDMRYLKSLPSGAEIALFYIELLLEGIDHDGRLRFNEMIPYDEEKLSVVTQTDLNIVKISIKTLTNLGLIEIWDDETIYLTKLDSMLGIGNGSDSNLRSKKLRDLKKNEKLSISTKNDDCNTIATRLQQNATLEKEKEKELEKELEKDIEVVSTSSSNLKESKKEIFDFLQSAFGRQITNLEIDAFTKLIDEYGVAEVEAATEISVLMSKFNIKYIEGVLRNRRDTKKEKREDQVEIDLSDYHNWIE